jgi:hypothetical protein
MLESNLGIKHKSTEKGTLLTYLSTPQIDCGRVRPRGSCCVAGMWPSTFDHDLHVLCNSLTQVLRMRRTVGIARWHHTVESLSA